MTPGIRARMPLILLAGVPLLLLAAGRPNFSGNWKLNRAASDNPRAKFREAMGRTARPGPPPGASRRHHPGRLLAPESMQITQTGDRLTLDVGARRPLRIRVDGTPHRRETRRGTITTETRWEGNKIVTVRQMGRRKITTEYELAEGGRRLLVTRTIEAPRFPKPVVIRSVYDKQP